MLFISLFPQRMFDNESREGRETKTEKPLKLPDCCLNGDDYLRITAALSGDVGDTWEHKLHPRENRPIEDEVKVNTHNDWFKPFL